MLALFAPGSTSAQHAADLQGQRGLYVWESADSVHVHWVTTQARAGVLRVTAGGETLNFTSAPGEAHHVALRKPRGDSYVLAVGDSAAVDQVTIYGRLLPASVMRPATDSLYIFGDTHGEYESVRALLRNAGLIDDQARWSGGRKQLVFLGDITDRGAEVTHLLWLIYRLEREAKPPAARSMSCSAITSSWSCSAICAMCIPRSSGWRSSTASRISRS
ncbi:MAG TPA: hypothetical protein VGC44_10940 [Longimicrobiales bacterium]